MANPSNRLPIQREPDFEAHSPLSPRNTHRFATDVQKIPLPTDAIPVRGPMFPVANAFVNHRLLGKTKMVDMIEKGVR
jgi:hypothetical protein